MKQKQKMNGLFIAGFVIAIVSVVACGCAAFVGYYLRKTEWAAVIGAAGALLAFVGIILTYCSKPKAKKREMIIDNSDEDVL